APPRDVAADAVDGGHLLAQQRAVLVPDPPGARELVAVERLDPPGGLGQRRLELPRHRRRAPLGLGNAQVLDRQLDAVEALGQLHQREVALTPHVVHDRGHAGDHGGRDRGGRPGERRHHAVEPEVRGRQPADHRAAPARSSSRNRATAWYAVLWAARFTIRRAVERMISATSTRPLARRVSPDWTRSTMRSASPTSGASSIEPSSRTTSTWIPRSAKYRRARVRDLVPPPPPHHLLGAARSPRGPGAATPSPPRPEPRAQGSSDAGPC